jgi:hypothetical protein
MSAEPWYESFFLLASHAPMVVLIFIAGVLLGKEKRLTRVEDPATGEEKEMLVTYYDGVGDASVFSIVLIKSFAYHLCQTGLMCLQPFAYLQTMDHTGVGSTGIYLWTLLIDVPFVVRIAIWAGATALISEFGSIYVHTYIVPLTLAPAFVGFAFARFVLVDQPVHVPDLINLAIAGALAAVGLTFFWIDNGVGVGGYWWTHSIWHVCIFTSIIFLYLAIRNVHFLRMVTATRDLFVRCVLRREIVTKNA